LSLYGGTLTEASADTLGVLNIIGHADTVATSALFNINESGGGSLFTVTEGGNVGINQIAPTATLHVVGVNTYGGLVVRNAATTPGDLLTLQNNAGTVDYLKVTSSGGFTLSNGAANLTLVPGGSSVMYALTLARSASSGNSCDIWDSAGSRIVIGPTASAPMLIAGANIGLGNMTSWGGGIGVVGLINASVVPSTDPTGGGILYSEAGALKWRGSSGTVTTLGVA